jgi:acetyl-CoA hydrolase
MALPFPVLTAEEAAEMIGHGETVGFSGFTPAGAAKAIPVALAHRAESLHATGKPFTIAVHMQWGSPPRKDVEVWL